MTSSMWFVLLLDSAFGKAPFIGGVFQTRSSGICEPLCPTEELLSAIRASSGEKLTHFPENINCETLGGDFVQKCKNAKNGCSACRKNCPLCNTTPDIDGKTTAAAITPHIDPSDGVEQRSNIEKKAAPSTIPSKERESMVNSKKREPTEGSKKRESTEGSEEPEPKVSSEEPEPLAKSEEPEPAEGSARDDSRTAAPSDYGAPEATTTKKPADPPSSSVGLIVAFVVIFAVCFLLAFLLSFLYWRKQKESECGSRAQSKQPPVGHFPNATNQVCAVRISNRPNDLTATNSSRSARRAPNHSRRMRRSNDVAASQPSRSAAS